MTIIKNTRSPPMSFRIPKRKAEKLETHDAFCSSESKKPKVEGAAGVKKSHDYESWYDELEDFVALPEWDEVDESSSSFSQVVSTTTTTTTTDESEAEAISKQDENSPIEATPETTDEEKHESDYSTLLNEVEETKEDEVSKPEEKNNPVEEEEAPKTPNENHWSDSPPLDYTDAFWLDPLVALPVCDDAAEIDYSSRGWDWELSEYQNDELLGFPDATRSCPVLGQSEETWELSYYQNDESLGFPSDTRTSTGLGQSGVERVTSFEELMSSAAGEFGCTSSIPSQPGKDQTDNEVVLIDSLGSKTYELKRNHDVIIID